MEKLSKTELDSLAFSELCDCKRLSMSQSTCPICSEDTCEDMHDGCSWDGSKTVYDNQCGDHGTNYGSAPPASPERPSKWLSLASIRNRFPCMTDVYLPEVEPLYWASSHHNSTSTFMKPFGFIFSRGYGFTIEQLTVATLWKDLKIRDAEIINLMPNAFADCLVFFTRQHLVNALFADTPSYCRDHAILKGCWRVELAFEELIQAMFVAMGNIMPKDYAPSDAHIRDLIVLFVNSTNIVTKKPQSAFTYDDADERSDGAMLRRDHSFWASYNADHLYCFLHQSDSVGFQLSNYEPFEGKSITITPQYNSDVHSGKVETSVISWSLDSKVPWLKRHRGGWYGFIPSYEKIPRHADETTYGRPLNLDFSATYREGAIRPILKRKVRARLTLHIFPGQPACNTFDILQNVWAQMSQREDVLANEAETTEMDLPFAKEFARKWKKVELQGIWETPIYDYTRILKPWKFLAPPRLNLPPPATEELYDKLVKEESPRKWAKIALKLPEQSSPTHMETKNIPSLSATSFQDQSSSPLLSTGDPFFDHVPVRDSSDDVSFLVLDQGREEIALPGTKGKEAISPAKKARFALFNSSNSPNSYLAGKRTEDTSSVSPKVHVPMHKMLSPSRSAMKSRINTSPELAPLPGTKPWVEKLLAARQCSLGEFVKNNQTFNSSYAEESSKYANYQQAHVSSIMETSSVDEDSSDAEGSKYAKYRQFDDSSAADTLSADDDKDSSDVEGGKHASDREIVKSPFTETLGADINKNTGETEGFKHAKYQQVDGGSATERLGAEEDKQSNNTDDGTEHYISPEWSGESDTFEISPPTSRSSSDSFSGPPDTQKRKPGIESEALDPNATNNFSRHRPVSRPRPCPSVLVLVHDLNSQGQMRGSNESKLDVIDENQGGEGAESEKENIPALPPQLFKKKRHISEGENTDAWQEMWDLQRFGRDVLQRRILSGNSDYTTGMLSDDEEGGVEVTDLE